MANLIIDPRDQKFVLYEMLNIEELCKAPLYADFSRDMFDMVLNEAEKFSTTAIFPTLAEGDREGCRLVDGNVHIPKCYHRSAQIYREGGWPTMNVAAEEGGQGFPLVVAMAAKEWFSHNSAFVSYFSLTEGAARLIETYGTETQKKKYLPKMHEAVWGGTMALTEPGAGTDVGNLKTKAIRRPDGTFRLQGTKIFITSGDSDIMENIIHPVLARIEGDPPGTGGISIFLVPKFLVNDDGTPGKRNDYAIGKIEEKMGIHGSATCLINLGDNGECYAELLGEERQGMKIMFQMMNGARIGIGIQSLSGSSIAYLPWLEILRGLLDWNRQQEMDRAAPTHIPVPSGSRKRLEYKPGEPPVLAVKLQEMFGLHDTPAVCNGRVPVMIHLLSPAQRPVQVTQDLRGFWQRTYQEVKKELKGRYPKHYWPDDPFSAIPTARVRPD